ncbi:MAG: hypothetical protein ACTSUK_03985 [Promethearchaeota archaeon]
MEEIIKIMDEWENGICPLCKTRLKFINGELYCLNVNCEKSLIDDADYILIIKKIVEKWKVQKK